MTLLQKGPGPNATNWDKVRSRSKEESSATRDVYAEQQLDRGRMQKVRSKKRGLFLGVATGILVFVVAWILYSLVATAILTVGASLGKSSSGPTSYYAEDTKSGPGGTVEKCYRPVDEKGRTQFVENCYASVDEVPVPDWFAARKETVQAKPPTLSEQFSQIDATKLFVVLTSATLCGLIVGSWGVRRTAAANLMNTTSDINQHHGDQHVQLPEEVQRNFDWFPDAGAHSSVQVSSMISHMMLEKKGLGDVEVFQRAKQDILDEDGNVAFYAGEILEDASGNPISKKLPMIDEAFGETLFEVSGVPKDPGLRKRYDTTKIPYNPGGNNRDKLGATNDGSTVYKNVSDLIRGDWELPEYETQRPAGAYMVDTAPVNTMVLAMTRAGKGQTYIEPVIDMWSREKRPSNMVINDPKGELLVKNYVSLMHRGFEPVQFNLINAMKTDIYNPLGMAADAAREGDSTKCALYIENIADVFFPVDGGEDPVWPNAANNAFKRAAYGLIDFYLEEERELREVAASQGMDPEVLDKKIDDLWGKVTLYNCYQLFVQLTSKKLRNPEALLEDRIRAGEFDDDESKLPAEEAKAAETSFLWEDKAEQDMLTLYFNATEALPTNTMRTLIGNANNALRAMAGAEKMLASVYGIAITAMSFFTDPTISTLTSGKPSQNTDLGGLSFPRRMGVRFAPDYVKRDHLKGLQAMWSAYSDAMFTRSLGRDFEHTDMVTAEGWARYYFEGKFPGDDAWIKLELVNSQTNMLVRTFYFHFKKGHLLTLNGRHFVVEPVTNKKIVKNGVLRELKPARSGGQIVGFQPGDSTFPQSRLVANQAGRLSKVEGEARAITQVMVRYSESPKAVFLVTPPHLMKYAKLILILIKQLVDLNFDRSYMTKSNQKPLYGTRFMLDELGNLQSEGHGISGFETMLSIGLGQDQQFTLILQTLQQLRDVYGESVDKIVQGNVSNIIFLKSTDDQMLETLEKMSGTTHVSRINSKQISQDLEKIVGSKTEGRVSYTMQTEAEPLIKYNDMATLPPRNSIIFRAGDAPVWNRNETILPMSYKLLEGRSKHMGRDFTLQTIPTLSSAMDFDVRVNQPDFVKMLNKRMAQASLSGEAKRVYQDLYGYSDVEISRLDPDVYSEDVMRVVTMWLDDEMVFDPEAAVNDTALAAEVAARENALKDLQVMRYAEGQISREMLINLDGSAKVKSLDIELGAAYKACREALERDGNFTVGAGGELRSADGTRVYISAEGGHHDAARRLNGRISDRDAAVYAEEDLTADDVASLTSVQIHAAFYTFLASLPNWSQLAGGEFDRAMAREMSSVA